jgi:hypothetical protein
MVRPIRRVTGVGLVLGLAVAPSAWGAVCAPAQVRPRVLYPASGQTIKVAAGAPVKLNGDFVRPAGCTLGTGLSRVKLYFERKTPAVSGQPTTFVDSAEPPLRDGKWSHEQVLPAGGYIVQVELVRSGESGEPYGTAVRHGFAVQVITLHPDAVKKSPFPKVPAAPK